METSGHQLLKDMVDDFLTKKDRPTVFNHRYISELAGLTTPTFSRTINAKRTPSFEEIRRLCESIERPDMLDTLSESFYGKENAKNLKWNDEKNFPFLKNEIQEAYANPRYFDIIALAYTKDGLSLTKYQEAHGAEGLIRINELAKKEYIKLDGDVVRGNMPTFQYDISTIKKLIPLSIAHHKTENMGKKRNQLFFHTGTVDKVKRTRLYDFLNLTRIIVREIIAGNITQDSKNKMLALMDFNHGDNQGAEEVIFAGVAFDDLKTVSQTATECLEDRSTLQ